MNVTCAECASVFRIDPAKVPAAGIRARCSVCGGVFAVPAAVPVAAVAESPTAEREGLAGLRTTPEPPPGSDTTAAAPPRPGERIQPHARRDLTEAPAPGGPGASEAVAAANVPTSPAPVPPAPVPPAPVPPAPVPPAAPGLPAPAAPATAAASSMSPPAGAARPPVPPVPPEPVGSRAETPNRPGPRIAPRAAIGGERGDERPSELGPPPSPAPAPAGSTRRFNPYLSNDPSQRARRLARALVSDLIAYNPEKREAGLRAGTLKSLFRDEIRKSWEEYVAQVGAPTAESTTHFQDALNDILAGGRKIF